MVDPRWRCSAQDGDNREPYKRHLSRLLSAAALFSQTDTGAGTTVPQCITCDSRELNVPQLRELLLRDVRTRRAHSHKVSDGAPPDLEYALESQNFSCSGSEGVPGFTGSRTSCHHDAGQIGLYGIRANGKASLRCFGLCLSNGAICSVFADIGARPQRYKERERVSRVVLVRRAEIQSSPRGEETELSNLRSFAASHRTWKELGHFHRTFPSAPNGPHRSCGPRMSARVDTQPVIRTPASLEKPL